MIYNYIELNNDDKLSLYEDGNYYETYEYSDQTIIYNDYIGNRKVVCKESGKLLEGQKYIISISGLSTSASTPSKYYYAIIGNILSTHHMYIDRNETPYRSYTNDENLLTMEDIYGTCYYNYSIK